MVDPRSPITMRLREMILQGDFAAEQRITETQLARTLGVSRTPVRLALAELEHEGLVEGAANRGFTVRSFSVGDISEAIDVRGTLEGMAARLAAEKGLSRRHAAALHECLRQGDALIGKGHMAPDEAEVYEAMNVAFHSIIVEAAGNTALRNALSRNNKIPFAGAGAVAFQDTGIMYQQFSLGHGQHHTIVEALEAGEGARAEALMREHALIAKKSLNLLNFGDEHADPADVPGLRLLRA